MKKRDINYYNGKIEKRLHVGQISEVYLLKDGRILKIFNSGITTLFKHMGYDIEKKILDSTQYQIDPKIKKPTEILYVNGIFCGYITEKAKGISFNERENELSLKDKVNLDMYATIHSNLERIIKNSEELIFPDLLTCDNIFIDKFLNIELIDFDGIQVGNNPVLGMSTSLGKEEKLLSSKKYYDEKTKLFTKQLDIKSLIHLYFLDVFNVDLNKVGMTIPNTNQVITLDDLFNLIELKDYDIMNKVWKLFQENHQNEYLDKDLFEIAENYKMIATPNPLCKGIYLKKLTRK